MTTATILLAYAALQSVAANKCYTAPYDNFTVVGYYRDSSFGDKTVSYRSPEEDEDTIFVNEKHVKTPCQLAGSIAYLSMYSRMAEAFPERYPIKQTANAFSKQAQDCCEKLE